MQVTLQFKLHAVLVVAIIAQLCCINFWIYKATI
jgi:hypothetical protein